MACRKRVANAESEASARRIGVLGTAISMNQGVLASSGASVDGAVVWRSGPLVISTPSLFCGP